MTGWTAGAFTVTVSVSVIAPTLAVMVADPTETPVTTPAPLMVATAGLLLLQFNWGGPSGPVLASLYVPVAVNETVFPVSTSGVAGEMAMETRAAVTVIEAVADFPFAVPVMVTDPVATPATRPVALTVALPGLPLLQATPEETGCVDPSL